MRHLTSVLFLLSCLAAEGRLGATDSSLSRGLLNFATEYSPGDEEDKGRAKISPETSHSSHSYNNNNDTEETDKSESANGGDESESAGGDESNAADGADASPASGEPVTSSGSSGGISIGAAVGIAVGGVAAAAAAFLAGRRTRRTQTGTAAAPAAEPTVFRKPESGSTSHVHSNPDMAAPSSASTDMDVVESSSRMDRV